MEKNIDLKDEGLDEETENFETSKQSEIIEKSDNKHITNTLNIKQEIPKNALYLGLLIKEPPTKIINIITTTLKAILDESKNIEDASNLLTQFENNTFDENNIWRFPSKNDKWHITT